MKLENNKHAQNIISMGKIYHSHQKFSGNTDWQVNLKYAQSLGLTARGRCYYGLKY